MELQSVAESSIRGESFEFKPGTILNDRYEVIKCLGVGSMGIVYACRHLELSGYLVAMKVLFPALSQNQQLAARFRNEIVSSYSVSDPNVVRTYEYFRDGGLLAFTMEYVEGGTLEDRMDSGKAFRIDEVVQILLEICSGVQAIHEAGIIHRDLKPSNILLTEEGSVKIGDFGIALTVNEHNSGSEESIEGTMDYISPEQVRAKEIDGRADIYAIGVIAYEMLIGSCPFQGDNPLELMWARLKTEPIPAHQLRSDCPLELSNIIMKALSREREARFQTAEQMRQALAQAMEKIEIMKPQRQPVNGPSAFIGAAADADGAEDASLAHEDTAVMKRSDSGGSLRARIRGSGIFDGVDDSIPAVTLGFKDVKRGTQVRQTLQDKLEQTRQQNFLLLAALGTIVLVICALFASGAVEIKISAGSDQDSQVIGDVAL